MVDGCTAGQRVQLDFGSGPNPGFDLDLDEVWRADDSIIEFNFSVPNQQCGEMKVLLVNSNGNPIDNVTIDCGKLFVSA